MRLRVLHTPPGHSHPPPRQGADRAAMGCIAPARFTHTLRALPPLRRGTLCLRQSPLCPLCPFLSHKSPFLGDLVGHGGRKRLLGSHLWQRRPLCPFWPNQHKRFCPCGRLAAQRGPLYAATPPRKGTHARPKGKKGVRNRKDVMSLRFLTPFSPFSDRILTGRVIAR